ncbi:MAG: porphobilinogen synthase [Verrucomicrobia bacterium]|nr:porphobilinogen synthase [Verrucomicrobiota bacterium]
MRRPRRNRKSPAIRALMQEARLTARDLVAVYFILDGEKRREAIASMPGVERISIDLLIEEAKKDYKYGIPAIALFPVISIEKKDEAGSEALNPEGIIPKALRALKKEIPQLCLISDVALDPFTSHGHDGLIGDNEEILNDATNEVLGKMALVLAQAGVDVVAPSDMMDGRIGHIRKVLDGKNFSHVSILSYAAKYASALYAPFRMVLSSGVKFGNKKTYQMDPANGREALLECALDEQEGADMLMVKPGLLYLDILRRVREQTQLPLAVFMVTGEYSMIMAAAQNGWLDEKKAFYEAHIAFKRAGADFILTYAARKVIAYLKEIESGLENF